MPVFSRRARRSGGPLVARDRLGEYGEHAEVGEEHAFYWAAITFSQTLGTALGDWMADSGGLGYEGGALVFAAGLAVVAGLYFWTSDVQRVLLFWTAFILTRPLGATIGDYLDKPTSDGGLALSRPLASAVIAAFIVICAC